MRWGISGLMCLAVWACVPAGLVIAEQSAAKPSETKAQATVQALKALQLPGMNGDRVPVLTAEEAGWTVVCFLGSECPLAQLYGGRLEQLSRQFADKRVRFLGVNSNLQDNLEAVRGYVVRQKLSFPFVKDYDHQLADLLAAERTPEVVVLNAAGEICYRGRIDDQYRPGTIKQQPDSRDLERALQELTSDKAVTVAETEAVGCLIGRAFEGEVTTSLTYCKQIAPLLQKHCVECHRPGEIGPFSLTDYEHVLGWAETLTEVVDEGRMPPWHANPEFGHFANARGMSSEEKRQLRDWVQGGMPFGNLDDLPEPTEYQIGWLLPRKPDVELAMSRKPYTVPAEGVVEYQYFVVDPGFKEETWITGAQVLPGNRAVVHHCIIFIRPPDGEEFRGLGWVAAYVPGQRSTMLPPGHGRRIPAGSKLVFQMHYTPTGTEQQDITRVGLLLGEDSSITKEVYTLPALNRNFEIPPGAENFAVSGGTTRFPQSGMLLGLAPHMHYRGKSFRAFAERDGKSEVLLDVPYYDFNWQHAYELQEQIPLKGVERLHFTTHFDNSPQNPFNPDPTAFVTWGDQTWEEMAIAFYEIAVDREVTEAETPREKFSSKNETQAILAESSATARNTTASKSSAAGEIQQASHSQRTADAAPAEGKRTTQAGASATTADSSVTAEEQFVDEFFEKFDSNRDGVILKGELPLSMQRFGFKQLDQDGNGRLDRDEIAKLYRQRK